MQEKKNVYTDSVWNLSEDGITEGNLKITLK
jgi:hypothetical protein